MERGSRGDGVLVCRKWTARSVFLQGESYNVPIRCVCGSVGDLEHTADLFTRSGSQAGEFFIENVLKKRRAEAAKIAAGELVAADAKIENHVEKNTA